ncbi:MAG: DUF1223 domain-containing protein [Alphaproteobacteria bacterium]|nr:DUF1223 domain-containing protein [Alphaproteobacteria bacterium]MBV9201097.1 DUF1223 domain-containing protein [Alphaproteobacteria bacterium]MBV9374141.1 DUF1223 domain-containing protein [Alphaproteobacteria bacterium]MBV9815341.1 DUF1223 domain-containing protein [Alphaproteobacteria bacterium]
MTRLGLLTSLIWLLLGTTPLFAGERPTVVELFTSEGCSSCPPADALLAELAARPDVLALSFHVDYWDRLGWKDPYSSADATRRQHAYADRLGLATVYTPQIVVDGQWQAVGSDRSEVEQALEAARRSHEEIPVVLAVDQGQAHITLGPGRNGDGAATLLLIGFDRRHVTAVARGENSGRTLPHVDVVRSIDEVAHFDGRARTFEVPIRSPCDRVAAILQARDGGILGVAVRDADAR